MTHLNISSVQQSVSVHWRQMAWTHCGSVLLLRQSKAKRDQLQAAGTRLPRMCFKWAIIIHVDTISNDIGFNLCVFWWLLLWLYGRKKWAYQFNQLPYAGKKKRWRRAQWRTIFVSLSKVTDLKVFVFQIHWQKNGVPWFNSHQVIICPPEQPPNSLYPDMIQLEFDLVSRVVGLPTVAEPNQMVRSVVQIKIESLILLIQNRSVVALILFSKDRYLH